MKNTRGLIAIVCILAVQSVAATANGGGGGGWCPPPCCVDLHTDFGSRQVWKCLITYPRCWIRACAQLNCRRYTGSGENGEQYSQEFVAQNYCIGPLLCSVMATCEYFPSVELMQPECSDAAYNPCAGPCSSDAGLILLQLNQWCAEQEFALPEEFQCSCYLQQADIGRLDGKCR